MTCSSAQREQARQESSLISCDFPQLYDQYCNCCLSQIDYSIFFLIVFPITSFCPSKKYCISQLHKFAYLSIIIIKKPQSNKKHWAKRYYDNPFFFQMQVSIKGYMILKYLQTNFKYCPREHQILHHSYTLKTTTLQLVTIAVQVYIY